MPQPLASQLCVLGGIAVISVGLLMTRTRLQRAKRVHQKKGLIHPTMPEGWGVWFFQGFSDVTMGTRWVVAVLVLLFWTVLGVSLVSLGIHLAR